MEPLEFTITILNFKKVTCLDNCINQYFLTTFYTAKYTCMYEKAC